MRPSACAKGGPLSRASERTKTVVAALLGLVVLAGAGALLVAWLGLYNVAASSGHWPIVERFLRFGMENSVKARASGEPAPSLDDDDLIRLGAGHFHAGCAFCHGAPGTPISPVAAGMMPSPPDLKQRVGHWRDQDLFRIVKHGIKYAGMPAFPVLGRDDEVWAVVAFLRRLPVLDEAGYRALAAGEVEEEPQSGQEIATGEASEEGAIGACARCHGAQTGPKSRLVPNLHGQPREMLAEALKSYASRERQSGVMQTMAAGLTEQSINRLAGYYAGLPPVAQRPLATEPDAARMERGRKLAEEGEVSGEIPACLSCHAPGRSPLYPRLAGQSARYLAGQLHVWKSGLNDRTALGAIMAPIARRLSADQIADVAAFLASQPAADEARR
ncbi:cytochrome c553 [Bosea sp. BK604]|nr:cytochrome c553 [Bosea sp. BK604]